MQLGMCFYSGVSAYIIGICLRFGSSFLNDKECCTCVYYVADEVGLAMFDTSGSTSPTSGQNCLYWVADELNRSPSVAANISLLPPCPCSGFQALFSPSHVYMPATDCFVTTNPIGIAMVIISCHNGFLRNANFFCSRAHL